MNSQKPLPSDNYLPLWVIVFATILTLFVGILSPYNLNQTQRWPALYYIQTAEGHFGMPVSPWAFRLAKPLLSGWMPRDPVDNFVILTYLGLIAGLLGVYLLLDHIKLTTLEKLVGLILYALSYPFRLSLIRPWKMDDWTLAILVFGILFIIQRKHTLFGLVFFLGALNHEHALFLIPLYILYELVSGTKRGIVFSGLYLIPGLIAFIAIRLIIPIPNEGFASYYLSWFNIKRCYSLQGGIQNILNLGYNTFGFLWLVALYGVIKKPIGILEKGLILFFPLTVLQLIIGCDTCRLLSINLPFLIPVSLLKLRSKHWGWTVFLVLTSTWRSLAKFAAISPFHPKVLIQTPTIVVVLIELLAFCWLVASDRNKSDGLDAR